VLNTKLATTDASGNELKASPSKKEVLDDVNETGRSLLSPTRKFSTTSFLNLNADKESVGTVTRLKLMNDSRRSSVGGDTVGLNHELIKY
jgi:hypothetical protein